MYRNKGAEREGEGDRHSGAGGLRFSWGGLSRASLCRGLEEAREEPGDDRRQSFQTGFVACLWLKSEKSRDESWFSLQVAEVIHWERKQDFEGDIRPEIKEKARLAGSWTWKWSCVTGAEPTRVPWKAEYEFQ